MIEDSQTEKVCETQNSAGDYIDEFAESMAVVLKFSDFQSFNEVDLVISFINLILFILKFFFF